MGPRFASLLQIQRFSLTSCRLAPQDKAWVYALPLSARLIVFPRRVSVWNHRTRLGSTLCLSPPSSACLLGESRARTAGQRLGSYFASLHQGQHVSSPKLRFPPQDKAYVHALTLSTRLSLCLRRVAGSHRTTRLGSTFCLSPQGSACVLAKSRARTAHQGLCPCFASLHQAHRDFSQSRELAPHDKAWVQFLPLSTTLSVSLR